MTSFVLKIIAMITMIIDHSGDVFNPLLHEKSLIFNAIGRIAFPLFAFMVVEGYTHTSNIKKYLLRLFIFALISEIPFYILVVNILHADKFAMDVLFTFVFGILALLIWDFKPQKNNTDFNLTTKSFSLQDIFTWIAKFVLISLLIIIATLLKFDYAQIGIILVLAIHLLFKKHKIFFAFVLLALNVFNYRNVFLYKFSLGVIFILTSSIIPLICMFLYNGKKGPDTKRWFYAVYPLHLIILEIIRYFFIK